MLLERNECVGIRKWEKQQFHFWMIFDEKFIFFLNRWNALIVEIENAGAWNAHQRTHVICDVHRNKKNRTWTTCQRHLAQAIVWNKFRHFVSVICSRCTWPDVDDWRNEKRNEIQIEYGLEFTGRRQFGATICQLFESKRITTIIIRKWRQFNDNYHWCCCCRWWPIEL